MKQQKLNNVTLVVEDEQSLYTPFSPDSEFNENVKQYIRSKFFDMDLRQDLRLTVISSSPLDEERFRSAAAVWIEEERAKYRVEEQNSVRLQRALFLIGATIVVVSTILKPHIEPLTFAVILIIGTAILGKGVTNWYEDVPALKARRWLLKEAEKKDTVLFEVKEP